MSKIEYSIFKNIEQAQLFEEQGYVVIDLLDTSSLDALKSIYKDAGLEYGDHFYSSSFIESPEIKAQISKKIEAVIDPAAEKHIVNFRKLGATFLVKPPGSGGLMPIHQDWTVVDESKFSSVTAWIPLQDTTSVNGTLKILPRSHKLSDALRSPTLPDPISEIRETAEPFMQTVPLEAGQAFVFSHALMHSSGTNNSGAPRIAIAYGMIHKEADLMFYFKPEGSDQVEVIEIGDDFFLNYPKPGERPEGKIKRTFSYSSPIISSKVILQIYGTLGENKFKKRFSNLRRRIAMIFGQH